MQTLSLMLLQDRVHHHLSKKKAAHRNCRISTIFACIFQLRFFCLFVAIFADLACR